MLGRQMSKSNYNAISDTVLCLVHTMRSLKKKAQVDLLGGCERAGCGCLSLGFS